MPILKVDDYGGYSQNQRDKDVHLVRRMSFDDRLHVSFPLFCLCLEALGPPTIARKARQ